MVEDDLSARRCLLLYTKPAHPGRVKTRLIGELSAEQAAELHAAFLGDLSERLCGGRFHLQVSWALEEGEEFPEGLVVAGEPVRQPEGDLGDRLYLGLERAALRHALVAAVGSDHPELARETVEDAFERLESGADAVLGPTADGGYYLIGLRRETLCREIFDGVPWSTREVFAHTLERCRRLGLEVALLPAGHDIDVESDLRRLAARLETARFETAADDCPRTRALLEDWSWLTRRSAR